MNYEERQVLNHMPLSVSVDDFENTETNNEWSRVPEVEVDRGRLLITNSLIPEKSYRTGVLQTNSWYRVQVCQLPKKVHFSPSECRV